jgi:RNA polymerase sigma-70 factor (ECF subfamily)
MRSDLVRRAQQGDGEAFATLIRAAYDHLYAVAERILRDRYAAEDAVQEAVVRSWRDIAGLRDPDRFDAWLYRLVVNASRDHSRRQRRAFRDSGVLPQDLHAEGDDYARIVENDALEGAFLTLSADHRIVLLLTHYAGYSAAEVATILSVPTGTVHSRLHYAMRAMRAALAPTTTVAATTTGAVR